MKKGLLLVVVAVISTLNLRAQLVAQRTQNINALDTVVFDLSQAIITGNQVSFPVSFLSDDTITSLDFSLKYNQNNLVFDSIIDLTTYMQSFSFYNNNDSTIRFTSNSLQTYTNDTELVSVRFNLLALQFNGTDLNTLKAYLNGSACSIKLSNLSFIGLSELNGNDNGIKVYPNPAKEKITVEAEENATVKLIDAKGKEVIDSQSIKGNQKKDLNIEFLSDGIYFLKIENGNFNASKKLIISR